MNVTINNEMQCQVFQHNRDVSEHQGKYLDLKRKPELASELTEAREWPALGRFIENINRTSAFRTCGCTASGRTPGGHEAPFVDIAFDDPRLRESTRSRLLLKEKLVSLAGLDVADDLTVELVESSATLPTKERLETTRLWFLGERPQAEQAFAEIVALLNRQNVSDYLRESWAANETRRDPYEWREGCFKVAVVGTLAIFVSAMVLGWIVGWMAILLFS